jgi:arylamine N-acetyltransferase
MEPELRDAYLARLGLEGEPPSVDALQRLHRAQVERVPYETMWIHMGDRWTIDLDATVNRIARTDRGGYCFHLNGAFSELLRSLGYDVVRHVGGVHPPTGPAEDFMSNHLVLTVRGLPNSDNPNGVWYVDAGLGDALYEALPLVAGDYDPEPFHLVLAETDDGVGDWHLTHDPLGAFAKISWRSGPATMADFAARHEWLSTSPESGFVRVATAQHRDNTGVDIIRGLIHTRVSDGRATEWAPLVDRADWFEVLADVFGLRFNGIEPELLDRLWARVLDAHKAFSRTQSA